MYVHGPVKEIALMFCRFQLSHCLKDHKTVRRIELGADLAGGPLAFPFSMNFSSICQKKQVFLLPLTSFNWFRYYIYIYFFVGFN